MRSLDFLSLEIRYSSGTCSLSGIAIGHFPRSVSSSSPTGFSFSSALFFTSTNWFLYWPYEILRHQETGVRQLSPVVL